MRKILLFFVFFQIFTSAFALSPVLTFSLAIGAILLIGSFLNGNLFYGTKEPPFLLLSNIILFISYLLFATGEKCFNHLLLWTIPPFLYYFVFKRVLISQFNKKEIENKVFAVITFSTIFSSSYAIFEFIAINFFNIDLSFIPRGMLEEYNPFALGNIRARSFMEESGHFSLFLEIFVPISIYWIYYNVNNILFRYILYAVFAIGLFVSFSAFGFACILMGLLLFLIYKFYEAGNIFKGLVIVTEILCGVIVLYFLIPSVFDSIWDIISGKLDSDNTSHSDRESRFVALKYLDGIHLFIGYGPAAFSTLKLNSFVSFYLGVLMSTGLIGLLFYIFFIIRQFTYVKNLSNKPLQFSLFLSLFFSVLHYAFIDNIYVPWFWVLLSLIYAFHCKEKKIIKKCLK